MKAPRRAYERARAHMRVRAGTHTHTIVYTQVAKRAVHAHEPNFIHSSEVARRKRFNPRVLGRITGNVFFTVSAVQML
jgi:hypothetical protein